MPQALANFGEENMFAESMPALLASLGHYRALEGGDRDRSDQLLGSIGAKGLMGGKIRRRIARRNNLLVSVDADADQAQP